MPGSKRSVTIFLIGLLVIALAALLVADVMLGDETAALKGAGAGIVAGAMSVLVSFFAVRGQIGGSNLRFMRAFFAGLAIRVLVLALAGLLMRSLAGWSLRHFLIAVGLSYPLYLMIEGWVLSRSLPTPRERREETKALED